MELRSLQYLAWKGFCHSLELIMARLLLSFHCLSLRKLWHRASIQAAALIVMYNIVYDDSSPDHISCRSKEGPVAQHA